MALDTNNAAAGGGDNSGVWVGPKGTTIALDLAPLEAPMEGVGWLSEDGLSFARDEDRQVFRAHQGGKVIKRKTANTDDSFKFQCLETTALTLGILYKGQQPVVTAGVAVTTIANQTNTDERAWVIDEEMDNGSTERYVIPNGAAQLTADVVYKTDELKVMEFTVGVNGDYYHITNAPGVVGA